MTFYCDATLTVYVSSKVITICKSNSFGTELQMNALLMRIGRLYHPCNLALAYQLIIFMTCT